jgi:fructose 1,6-bisphosphate aldolase/phosphatase
MYPGRYVVSSVYTKDNQPILAASTDRLHNIAGKYVGKDDPICIIRTQKDFPATEEVGSAFSNPHYVAGNTRGSHHMPLMPVKINSAASINFAIPIVSSLVFSMHNGILVGPVDGFATEDWDYVRNLATKRAFAMRSQGFFHPATLVPSELEYSEGYRARMNVVWSKMRPIAPNNQQKSQQHKPSHPPQPHQQKQTTKPQQQKQPSKPQQQKTTKPKPQKARSTKPKQKPSQPETKPEEKQTETSPK